MLNVSIRYVPKDDETLLSYAPQDSFALVCYINVFRSSEQAKERQWTQQLIDAALSLNGTFYSPYHLYAKPEQFRQSYPQFEKFLEIKKAYDPCGKFNNSLYANYMAAS